MITAERLREVLSYAPETGRFTWLVKTGSRTKVGAEAGCVDISTGYIKISIDGRQYYAHRLAWVHVYGVLPAAKVDHVNGNVSDNRMVNLRAATHAENLRNRGVQKNNTTGFKGVTLHASIGKWRAAINRDGRKHHLGVFDTPAEAHAAYRAAAEQLHGTFARVA